MLKTEDDNDDDDEADLLMIVEHPAGHVACLHRQHHGLHQVACRLIDDDD